MSNSPFPILNSPWDGFLHSPCDGFPLPPLDPLNSPLAFLNSYSDEFLSLPCDDLIQPNELIDTLLGSQPCAYFWNAPPSGWNFGRFMKPLMKTVFPQFVELSHCRYFQKKASEDSSSYRDFVNFDKILDKLLGSLQSPSTNYYDYDFFEKDIRHRVFPRFVGLAYDRQLQLVLKQNSPNSPEYQGALNQLTVSAVFKCPSTSAYSAILEI